MAGKDWSEKQDGCGGRLINKNLRKLRILRGLLMALRADELEEENLRGHYNDHWRSGGGGRCSRGKPDISYCMRIPFSSTPVLVSSVSGPSKARIPPNYLMQILSIYCR